MVNSVFNVRAKFVALKGPFTSMTKFLTTENPLKNGKCILFYVKMPFQKSFRSWDIYIFMLASRLCRKTAW